MDPVELLRSRRLATIKNQVDSINYAIGVNSPWPKGTWVNDKLTKAVEVALYLLMEVMDSEAVDDRLVRMTDFVGGWESDGLYHIKLQDTRLRVWYGGENVSIADIGVKELLPGEDPTLRSKFKWFGTDTNETLYTAFCKALEILEDTTFIQHSLAFTGFCTPFIDECKLIVSLEKSGDSLKAHFFNESINTYVVCTLYCKLMFDSLELLKQKETTETVS